MKRYLYILLCVTATACAVLSAGCAKDPNEDSGTPGDGKTIKTTFMLTPAFLEEIEVRSVTGVDERLIKDLWVIQLNEAGTAQLQEPQYITSLTQGPNDYKVSVSLKRSESRVYFIANTHDEYAYKGKTTAAEVESVTMAVVTEASIASSDGVLMSAVWKGTPDLLGIAGQVALSRAVSKINFKLDASLPKGESFLLTGIQIKQVPNKLHGYRDAATTGAFPVSPTVTNYDPTSYAKVNLTTDNSQSTWWYLPENARGTGTATTQGEKASKFPTDQKDYCTYIEITGDYLLGNGQGFKSTYKIYLGSNNTTDYNINRNTVYNVNTTIKGIDAADTRINLVEIAPLDYTDNGSAWFLIAPYDTHSQVDSSDIMNWYIANGVYDIDYNPNTLNACPAGWRMPTHLECNLIWIYKKNTPQITNGMYWTGTDVSSTSAWRADMNSGFAYSTNISKASNYRVRCVKDVTNIIKYPYVGINDSDELRVIVSRDGNGGVGFNAVRSTNWTSQTPVHTYADPDNSVPAMLELSTSNCNATNAPGVPISSGLYTWDNAIQACAAYSESGTTAGMWRLPTQRELKLVWSMQAKGEMDYKLTGNSHWTATELTYGGTVACVVSAASGVADNNRKETPQYVRCVRDVTGAKRPPIIVGMFGGWDNTTQEYTKQLQVDWGNASSDPALAWGPDNEATGATNKEYGPTNITELKKKSADLSLYPAAKYCADKGDGWYLPSQNQLMAIWIANNSIPTNFSFDPIPYYWSATELNSATSWYVYFTDGTTTGYNSKVLTPRVRCVKDVTPQGTAGSQVTTDVNNRAIIDNRTMPAKSITLSKKPRDIAGGIATTETNKTVSCYFEVAKDDYSTSSSWSDAVSGCAGIADDGKGLWRLPTQRELQLIWTLHKTLTKKTGLTPLDPSVNYWSATEFSLNSSWCVYFGGGNTGGNGRSNPFHVRCVRDITPPAN